MFTSVASRYRHQVKPHLKMSIQRLQLLINKKTNQGEFFSRRSLGGASEEEYCSGGGGGNPPRPEGVDIPIRDSRYTRFVRVSYRLSYRSSISSYGEHGEVLRAMRAPLLPLSKRCCPRALLSRCWSSQSRQEGDRPIATGGQAREGPHPCRTGARVASIFSHRRFSFRRGPVSKLVAP